MKDNDLRDFFAIQAMNGLVSNLPVDHNWTLEDIASEAYEIADAMIKARTQPTMNKTSKLFS